MKSFVRTLFVAVLFAAPVACGAPPEPHAPDAEGHHHGQGDHHGEGDHHGQREHHGEGEHHGEEHGAMPGSLHDLHEILAPLWHMAEGADRVAKICDQQPALLDRAKKVAADATPEAARADEAGWKAATQKQVTDLDPVAAACATPDKAGVTAAFSTFHDDFHALLARLEAHK